MPPPHHPLTHPHTTQSPGDVTMRACAFSTDTGLGAFATLPLAKQASGQRAAVGVRYSSPIFTSGAVLQPATNTLSHIWLCGRHQGMTCRWTYRGEGGSKTSTYAMAWGGGGWGTLMRSDGILPWVHCTPLHTTKGVGHVAQSLQHCPLTPQGLAH
jgi:hypothetical protein